VTKQRNQLHSEGSEAAKVIVLPALRIRQSRKKEIFQFTIDGKQLPRIAAISRIHRDGNREVAGYQRPEALAHIASIRKYIESESPMIPNSIVIAFKDHVRFVPIDKDSTSIKVQMGHLHIPALTSPEDDGEVIGWIVDGQQRSAAIRGARVKEFLIPVTAFVASTDAEQREQFILVNSVKPLSKSLIYELLPSTDALLPAGLARRRLAATVLDSINADPKSPFFGKVQMPTNPEGSIKDNTVLRMLDHSILDGILYNFRDPRTGDGDVKKMCAVVNNFFSAVQSHFPDDWEKKPQKSRLVHGVGIVSMGFLMDEIAGRMPKGSIPSKERFSKEVARIAPNCHWSSGRWKLPDIDRRRKESSSVTRYKWVAWNDLQNTSKDLGLLTAHILDLYKRAKEFE
jgi:DNA sulfur modification protein DndB